MGTIYVKNPCKIFNMSQKMSILLNIQIVHLFTVHLIQILALKVKYSLSNLWQVLTLNPNIHITNGHRDFVNL